MKRLNILCLIIFLLPLAAFSQHYKDLFRKADRYFTLEEPTEKTDSIAAILFLEAADIAIKELDFRTGIESFIKAGSIRQTYHRYSEAAIFYRKAIDLNQHSAKDTSLFYQAFLYLGSTFYSTGNIDSASSYFEKASVLSMFHPRSEDFPDQERLYNSLGTIHFESANYQQAKNYFEKALTAFGPLPTHPDETVVTLQSNIANCLLRLRQYPQAIRIFTQLLRSGMQTRVIRHNIAHSYFEVKEYDSALRYFAAVPRQNDIVTIRTQNDLGRIYTAQKKWTDALHVLDSSRALSNKLFPGVKNRDRALNFFTRSLLAEEQQKPDDALRWCNEALREIHFRFQAKDLYDVPENETETLSPITFLELLQQKARLLETRYKADGSRKDLESCFRAHLMATRTASYIKRCFDNDEAKLYFQHERSTVYHDALRIAHELMDDGKGDENIDALVEINEAYKGSIVYENVRHLSLSAHVKLPAWALEKGRSLKQSLSFYTTRLNYAASPEETKRLRNSLVATNVELSRVLALYDRDPAYQFFRNQRAAQNSFKSISAKLDNETAIVSYSVTPRAIYILGITNNGFKTVTVRRDSLLNASFGLFIDETYELTEGRRYTGYHPGSELYKLLVEPLDKMLSGRKNLVILPDGFLSYLPFDALCVTPKERDYLILQKQISYHYSFSLLMMDNEKTNQPSASQKLFFAPFNTETAAIDASGMQLLPFSRNEAPDTGVTMLLSSSATRSRLLASIENTGQLHLATHAKTGNEADTSALIYFYPGDSLTINNNLYVDEIYGFNLQHMKLVVLSACETAGGQSTSGEGLLSLSRAFLYAGAKGIVSSLWKTEDGVSAYLMKQMYGWMQKGYSSEAALREAKLSLLRNDAISARFKTPNYWSNFVYIGSIHPNKSNLHSAWWVTGAVVLILVVVIVARKIIRAT